MNLKLCLKTINVFSFLLLAATKILQFHVVFLFICMCKWLHSVHLCHFRDFLCHPVLDRRSQGQLQFCPFRTEKKNTSCNNPQYGGGVSQLITGSTRHTLKLCKLYLFLGTVRCYNFAFHTAIVHAPLFPFYASLFPHFYHILRCSFCIFCIMCSNLCLGSRKGIRPVKNLSLIHIWRCRRIERCRSRWSPYH